MTGRDDAPALPGGDAVYPTGKISTMFACPKTPSPNLSPGVPRERGKGGTPAVRGKSEAIALSGKSDRLAGKTVTLFESRIQHPFFIGVHRCSYRWLTFFRFGGTRRQGEAPA